MALIAAISDLHLTNSLPYTVVGDSFRKAYLMKYLDFFFKEIDDAHVDYLVVPGDVCHNSLLDPDDLSLLEYFLYLVKRSDLDTMIISGNHDMDGEKSILSFLVNSNYNLKNIQFENTYQWKYVSYDIVFHCINFCNNSVFLDCAERAVVDAKNYSDRQNILIGHVGVKGSLHGTTKSILGVNQEDIDRLAETFDFIFLGHHHKFQWINERCIYVGAPQQTRIDEINCIPGGVIIDTQQSGKIFFIENRFSPRFSILDTETFRSSEVKGKIVKPVFEDRLSTEEMKTNWLKEIIGCEPYYLIKPRLREKFENSETTGFSSTDKRKALFKTMKSFNEKKKRPKSFYKHALKLYEEEVNKGG